MALQVLNVGLDASFLDVECRLEGARVDWDSIDKIYKDGKSPKGVKKDEYDSITLEALNFYRKKRFWVNLRFAVHSRRYASAPFIYGIEIDALKRAKDWVLEASPVEWEGMVSCLESIFFSFPGEYSLSEAKDMYYSLL